MTGSNGVLGWNLTSMPMMHACDRSTPRYRPRDVPELRKTSGWTTGLTGTGVGTRNSTVWRGVGRYPHQNGTEPLSAAIIPPGPTHVDMRP